MYKRIPDKEIYELIEDIGPSAKIIITLANNTRDTLERKRRFKVATIAIERLRGRNRLASVAKS